VRLWGRHAVEAALTNPNRTAKKLWGTREAIQEMLDDHDAELPRDLPVEYAQAVDLARLVARDAPHQGLVLECLPLDDVALDDVLDEAEGRTLVLLDQVTDPHNVGAILRSCAAFDVAALITQDRHAPPESGTLAKSASGALEVVPWVRVVNLARALESISEAGYWRIGLDGEGTSEFPCPAGRPGAGAGRRRRRHAPQRDAALRLHRAAADQRGDRKPQRLQRGRHCALCRRHARPRKTDSPHAFLPQQKRGRVGMRRGPFLPCGNWRDQFTASFRPLPALNLGWAEALIAIGSPVRLRPVDALRLATENVPKPTRRTSSPLDRAPVMDRTRLPRP
jgi:hypothetical protein